MSYKKHYTVELGCYIEVKAFNEEEAQEKACEIMQKDYELTDFNKREVEEGECVECGGTGEVPCDEDDGEGHTERGVGTQKCICQADKEEEHEPEE